MPKQGLHGKSDRFVHMQNLRARLVAACEALIIPKYEKSSAGISNNDAQRSAACWLVSVWTARSAVQTYNIDAIGRMSQKSKLQ